MRTTAALLLALGSAGGGFIAARLLFHSDPEGAVASRPADSSLEIQSANEPLRSASSEPPALEMPDSRVPVLTERSLEPAPPVQPTEQAKPVAPIDPSDPRTLPESTLAEMEKKREAVQEFLLERTTPLLMQRFDDGLAELAEVGEKWTSPDYERMRTVIYAVRYEEGQGWYRAVLPREQYPDLYVHKDDVYRLENAIREREIAEALERANAHK
jgi:hypothetical protein